MTQPGLLELAKQGDPQAIATLLNRHLQTKGILAKANIIKGCLQIIFEATEIPPQQAIANYIYTSISKLNDKQPQTLSDQGIDTSRTKNSQSIIQSTTVVVQPVVQHEMQIRCPKCSSTQITSNKKGFNVGQALIGGLATGGLGLVAGLWGSNDVRLNCLSCGNRWKPSKQIKPSYAPKNFAFTSDNLRKSAQWGDINAIATLIGETISLTVEPTMQNSVLTLKVMSTNIKICSMIIQKIEEIEPNIRVIRISGINWNKFFILKEGKYIENTTVEIVSTLVVLLLLGLLIVIFKLLS